MDANKPDKFDKMKKYKALYELITDTLKPKNKIKKAPPPQSGDTLTPALKCSETPKVENKRVRINVKKNEYISPVRERELNKYQQFLRTESSKTKYKNKSPKSRMKAIAEAWNSKK